MVRRCAQRSATSGCCVSPHAAQCADSLPSCPLAVCSDPQSTLHEQKYDDHTTDAIRFSKDDYKQQQADVRRGTKQQDQPLTIGGTEFILQESIVHDSNQSTTGSLSGGGVAPTPANAALAPIVQASALQSQKSHLGHVDLPYEGEFGSIHMNEGTVPSQAELPSAIGESAGEGFEKLKDMAQPQIAKAKEAITHLKDSMTSGSSSDKSSSGGALNLEQAKAKVTDLTAQAKDLYTEKIAPQIAQAKEAVQPQIEGLKTKVVEKTNELKQRATAKSTAGHQQPGLEHRAIKTYHAPGHQQQAETMQHRMIRYRNKAMEIWAGQEPMLRARSQQALRWIRKNRMEIPLLALGTLLVLWASLSFIGWIAWPNQYSPAREQMVLYNSHQAAVPVHHHDTLVNGPSQDVQGPSTIDKMKMSMGDSMDDIKMKTMDRISHAMPSMPSMDSVKDAMPSVDDVKNAMPEMPSMDDVKDAMPSMHQMKDAIHMPDMHAAPSLNSMKESLADAIPSVDQVKNAMPSMDAARAPDMNAMKESVMNAASDIKDAMPASAGGFVNRMKEGVQHIKERINVATGAASKHTTQQATVPAHEPNTPPHLHTQPQQIPINIPQMMNAEGIAAGDDINAPPHLHNDGGVLHQA